MFTAVNTALLVIDIQEKLFRVIHEKETLLDNMLKLVRGLKVLGVPVLLTEQNPKGLGPTLPEITALLPEVQPCIKFDFSCFREPAFRERLESLGRKQLLLTGIETHICVYQTALELAGAGYQVRTVTDCVSSRTPANRDTALLRMALEGIMPATTEMILFELLGTARHENFREISSIVR